MPALRRSKADSLAVRRFRIVRAALACFTLFQADHPAKWSLAQKIRFPCVFEVVPPLKHQPGADTAEDSVRPRSRAVGMPSGCFGQQCGRRCNPSAGRYDSRSDQGHLLRQRPRPKFARCCCSSSPGSSTGYKSGALTGMMGLSPEQAAAIKEQERARIPLGRRGVPDDVAEWIVQLIDPASEWMTGQVVAVDGGLGLA
jgi:hypothetical protein